MMWNVLLDYIRKGKNFDKFKKLFNKTYYFREAYGEVLLFSTLISFFSLLLVFGYAKLLM